MEGDLERSDRTQSALYISDRTGPVHQLSPAIAISRRRGPKSESPIDHRKGFLIGPSPKVPTLALLILFVWPPPTEVIPHIAEIGKC